MAEDLQTRAILGLAMTIGVAVAAIIGYFVVISTDAGSKPLKFRNPSGSMEPTILIGDYVTARRLPRVVTDPSLIRRGEIVLHQFPDDTTKWFMKRVIGLPGDTIEMRDGVVWINGQPLRETYTLTTDSADPVADEFRWQRAYLVGNATRDTAHYIASRRNGDRSSYRKMIFSCSAIIVTCLSTADTLDSSLLIRCSGAFDACTSRAIPASTCAGRGSGTSCSELTTFPAASYVSSTIPSGADRCAVRELCRSRPGDSDRNGVRQREPSAARRRDDPDGRRFVQPRKDGHVRFGRRLSHR